MYYVAREFLNRKDPIKALYYLEDYTKIAPHTNELADAWYLIATCYIDLGRLRTEKGYDIDPPKLLKAVDAVLQTIKYLPTYKAAYALLYNLATPDNRPFWEKMFHMANNKNVLFVRRENEKLFKLEIEKGKK